MCVCGVAMHKNGETSAGIELLSEWSGDVFFDITGCGSMPRVVNLARRTLAAIGLIWVIALLKSEVAQETAQ